MGHFIAKNIKDNYMDLLSDIVINFFMLKRKKGGYFYL